MLGCDLVVTASNKVLETIKPDHTAVVFSDYEMSTADFTRKPNLKVPGAALRHAIEERAGKAPVHHFDAHTAAVKLFGDSIASNMFLLGYAYQLGRVPIGAEAIEQAIELNGAAVEMSRNAFRFGRLAAHDAGALARMIGAGHDRRRQAADAGRASSPSAPSSSTEYQDAALAERYRARVARIAEIERGEGAGPHRASPRRWRAATTSCSPTRTSTRWRGSMPSPAFEKALGEQFEARRKLEFHLAPPLLARRDKETGEPRKMQFGAWMLPVFRLLAKGKGLRGTALGRVRLHGRAQARAADDRRLRDAARRDRASGCRPARTRTAVALASLPLDIKRLRPHQGAQLQGGQGPREDPAGRAAQSLADGAEGGGVVLAPITTRSSSRRRPRPSVTPGATWPSSVRSRAPRPQRLGHPARG